MHNVCLVRKSLKGKTTQHYPLLKAMHLLILFFITLCVASAQMDSSLRSATPASAGLTRTGIFQNGFMTPKGQTVYSNVFILMNEVTFGAFSCLSIGGTIVILPLSGQGGSGTLPVFSANLKSGVSAGRFNHFAVSSSFAISSKSAIMHPKISYTFGTPRLHAGIVCVHENLFNESVFVLLQSRIPVFKWLLLSAEHVIITTSKGYYYKDSYSGFREQSMADTWYYPFSFTGEIVINNVSLAGGYFTEYKRHGYIENIPYLRLNVRIQKKNSAK